MKLIKRANKTFLRMTREEWNSIGSLFKDAGALPAIPMKRWLEYLKEHGYYYHHTNGSHQTWYHYTDPSKKSEFASHNDKIIHPIVFKTALDKMRVSVPEFMSWYNEYYYNVKPKKKGEEEEERQFDIQNLPHYFSRVKWEEFIRSRGYVPVKSLTNLGNRQQWFSSYDNRTIFWTPQGTNGVELSEIIPALKIMDEDIENFWKWYLGSS